MAPEPCKVVPDSWGKGLWAGEKQTFFLRRSGQSSVVVFSKSSKDHGCSSRIRNHALHQAYYFTVDRREKDGKRHTIKYTSIPQLTFTFS